MVRRYACPVCKHNQTQFEIIYKLSQQIQKDPETGAVIYASDSLETPMVGRRPDIDVRCSQCGYIGNESVFIKTALREYPR